MLTRQFSLNPLRPAHSDHLSVTRNVRLPVGGPVGTGGKYLKGQALGCVGGAPASEVRTLTVSGSPTTMTGYFTYVADKVYQSSATSNASGLPTAAQLQSALQEVFPTGSITVTFSTNVFTIAFGGPLANARIGGKLTFTPTFTGGSTPAAALATSAQGNSGAGQYDAYNHSALDGTATFSAILKSDYTSDPAGGLALEAGPTNQPYSPESYTSGFFNVADVVGLDSFAATAPGVRLEHGTSLSDAGAVLRLS